MVDTASPDINKGITETENTGLHVQVAPDKKPEAVISSPVVDHQETAQKIATYSSEALGIPVTGQDVIAHPPEEVHPDEDGSVKQMGGEWVEIANNMVEQDLLRALNGAKESGPLDLVHEGQRPTEVINERENKLRKAWNKITRKAA
jgi:hypothetical protein